MKLLNLKFNYNIILNFKDSSRRLEFINLDKIYIFLHIHKTQLIIRIVDIIFFIWLLLTYIELN